jgi:hypothetical protein
MFAINTQTVKMSALTQAVTVAYFKSINSILRHHPNIPEGWIKTTKKPLGIKIN